MRRQCLDARAALRSIAADQALLDDEIGRRERALAISIGHRTTALAEVLRPTAEAMLAAMRAHIESAAALRTTLAALPVGTLPNHWDARGRT